MLVSWCCTRDINKSSVTPLRIDVTRAASAAVAAAAADDDDSVSDAWRESRHSANGKFHVSSIAF